MSGVSCGMILGYARTSTVEQEAGLEAQLRDLEGAGVERPYREQTSSMGAPAARSHPLLPTERRRVFS
jgi:DNA invertase Pin-like site-specific DNA recombinase